MLKLLFKIVISLSCVLLVSLNATDLKNSLNMKFDDFIKYNAGNIYNFNETAVKENIKFLLKNEQITAIKIDDISSKKTFWQGYIKEGKIVIGKPFFQKISKLKSSKKDVFYKGKKIASVTFYYIINCSSFSLA